MATAGMPAAGGGSPAAADWPAANPAMMGPFQTVTEMNVGPGMAYTMFRPMMLERRHPVITWGNGTGAMPSSYRALLTLYASHGFIVIASNSENVAQGTPPPMLNGVTWVLEQDMMMGTALYQKVDREKIGATGHSQGAFATTSAGADERIKTIAPLQSLSGSRGLHGPVLALCGTMDTLVPCSRNLTAYNGVMNLPAMYAELKTADHTMWVRGGAMHPYFSVTTAWFRVHLMNDQALRPMFYGTCSVCQDTANWVTMRKMMD
jgi:Chlorophyllase enzyme